MKSTSLKPKRVTTIYFDPKGKSRQVINHSENVEPGAIQSMVESITMGNFYNFKTVIL